MRTAYRTLALVIATAVALQAASVAFGMFLIIHEVEHGGAVTSGYDWEGNLGVMTHRVVGLGLIPLTALALFVVSLVVAVPDGRRRAGTVLGLVVLQIALVFLAFTVEWGGALHGANALLVFLAALWAARLPGLRPDRWARGREHDTVPA